MTKQLLQASPQGAETIRQALKRRRWSQTDLAGQVFCSRQAIGSLLKGEPKESNLFKSVCKQLGLNWEEIAEQESAELETIAPSNIDNLVQEVRDRINPLIEQACGTMRVLDMSYPIGLDSIYTDVNILERLTSSRGLKLAEMMQEAGREQFERFCLGDVRQERVPALEAVERFSKLMILGKPGAGKTTFLKRLAMQCIGGKFKADYVPVFVTLKDFGDDDRQPNLLEYCKERAGESFEAIAKAGRVIILLDGLDEVREVDSDRVLRQIKAFSQQFAQNCFVITCRIAAKEYIYEQFTEVEVADFDDKQIAEFSNNWFRSRNDAVKAKRFLEKLEEDKPVRELAASPLLLTLLCLVFEDSGDFPTNRAELYQNGVNVLLKKWDVKRNIERDRVYKGLSLKRKEALLGQIARKTFEAGNYFFKQREAERYISEYIQNLPDASTDPEALEVDSAAVLKSIEAHHGLFVERARGIYSFSHLTFHEYFTAQEFAKTSDPQQVEQALQTLVNRITEKRYREVFLLTVGMLPSADYLIRLMKSAVDALLAKDTVIQQFLIWLKRKSTAVDTSYKPSAVRAYYLDLVLNRDRDRNLAPIRSLDLDLDLDPNRSLDNLARNLARARALNLNRSRNLDRAIDLDLDLDLNLSLDLNLNLNLNLARNLARALNLNLARNLDCTIDRAIAAIDRARAIAAIDLNHELQKEVEKLQDQLPDPSYSNSENFKQWWQANGHDWTEQLRAVMIEHRNIGHDWKFTDQQKKLLQQYYDANLLLVDCLNSDCYVSREVRQEIEETLLLPIADIEAWKKNKGKL